ncbi:hypothetical protein INT47_000528 [Mucor saturninus]|uniref:Uncharacterized protein n=1 Tax=Mucor saturninus TaxID=64648 RepID=A0A8H7R034_9FUNG|nr:hypothetical protein INT47_000528 [Mucor saturninus]
MHLKTQLPNIKTTDTGEVELKAMTLNNILTEELLSEVSSAFVENNKAKASFDHYKAMLGLLMILKTFAKKFTSSTSIVNQAICPTPSPGLYLMNKEQKVEILEKFEEKSVVVMPLITFSLSLGASLEETLNTIAMLTKEHDQMLREIPCEISISPASLLDLVNPVVVRSNEKKKHKDKVGKDGLQSPSS